MSGDVGRRLFDPARHQALSGPPWNAALAREGMERITQATRAAFTAQDFWPLHPDDAEEGETGPHCNLYFGAGGVIWALDHLAREGAISDGPTFADHLPAVAQRNRAELEGEAWRRLLGPGWQTRSWLMGDAGLLFVRQRTAADSAERDEALARLAVAIADNTHDPSLDQMWGAPGTMLPALTLHRAGTPGPWAELFRAGADALDAALKADPALGADVWTQTLYGGQVRYLGAGHGFAGAAFALIAGRDLLSADRWTALSARLGHTLRVTAVSGDEGSNWPAFVGQDAERAMLLQHCHGAPGMITGLSALDQPVDDLLLDAGRLIWTAGPLTKGAGLCHGTAGAGMALLKLFVRTGDRLWLDRARAFAMHALAQTEAEAGRTSRRRHSLWTGDIGVACFVWECLRETARFPTMDLVP